MAERSGGGPGGLPGAPAASASSSRPAAQGMRCSSSLAYFFCALAPPSATTTAMPSVATAMPVRCSSCARGTVALSAGQAQRLRAGKDGTPRPRCLSAAAPARKHGATHDLFITPSVLAVRAATATAQHAAGHGRGCSRAQTRHDVGHPSVPHPGAPTRACKMHNPCHGRAAASRQTGSKRPQRSATRGTKAAEVVPPGQHAAGGPAHNGIHADFEAVLRVGQRGDAVARHWAGLALGRRADQLARLLLLALRRRQHARQVAVVVRLARAGPPREPGAPDGWIAIGSASLLGQALWRRRSRRERHVIGAACRHSTAAWRGDHMRRRFASYQDCCHQCT